jgi:16S rRNA (cytidine1402-2'-O)-methyltransferase
MGTTSRVEDVSTGRAGAAGAERRFDAEAGTLYVVATPLGNLRDLTLRALDVLASADVVAAEDTRVTATLLARYAITKRPIAVHMHNEARGADAIVRLLGEGRSVALVTDAGTPAISDPGARVVRAARDAGHPVVPIPGPCAIVTALSASGIASDGFHFAGFLPQQAKARRERLAALAALPCPVAFYEAPHRVRATVRELAASFPERTLVVARELTKAFETITALPIADADAWFAGDPNRVRGEFVLIVDAPREPAAATLSPDVDRWLAALVQELPPARAARVAAAASGVARNTLYARAQALKGEHDGHE